MGYIKTYKSFLSSHHVSEGVRITVGTIVPAFVLSLFNMLPTGILLSLGALFVSITDSPGPIHHRKNGMLTCIAAIFIIVVITRLVSDVPVLLAVFLVASCFFFSMINIYGARAGSIGIAVLLVLTINVDHGPTGIVAVLQQAFYIACGGLWYMFFSLLLYKVRPYRLVQQTLGEYIQEVAEYLRIRANLYKKDVDYEGTYTSLLQQQAVVQQKQTVLTDIIFKTRSLVKETTSIGRILVMIHFDVADIFERIMMSHQRYSLLHQYFDTTDILQDYHNLAIKIAEELDEIGMAVKSGQPSASRTNLLDEIRKTKQKREQLRLTFLKPDNVEGFISLRRIIENLEDLAERLQTLRKYSTYSKNVKRREISEGDYQNLITSQQISTGLFINNLSFKSDIFKHSIRLSVAILIGYLATLIFKTGHSYWVLLTIVVIVKPAYSLTKTRNKDRLIGTIIGVLAGIGILFMTKNSNVLLCLMVLLMAIAYSFMRTNYFISVLFMTPYLILFYHLLNPNEFSTLLKDRVLDTAIGSVIAFFASLFFLPSWEREKLKPLLVDMVRQEENYFLTVANRLLKKQENSNDQHVARKNTLVALANLSDTFNRMLSEPKRQQAGAENLHRFIVLNHMLTSYIASLSQYVNNNESNYQSNELQKLIEEIRVYFSSAISCLEDNKPAEEGVADKESLRLFNERVNELLQKRREEIQLGQLETSTKKTLFDVKSIADQFNLIYNVAADLNKISQRIHIA